MYKQNKMIKLSLIASVFAILNQNVKTNLPYTNDYYSTSTTIRNGQSFSIEPSNSFSSCTCNLTPNGCDEACCCDPDCPAATVSQWRLSKSYCLDEINDQKILKFNECLDRTFTGGIDDLQDGLKVYGKNIRALFCITSSSSRETISSFVDKQYRASDATTFNNTLDSLAMNNQITATVNQNQLTQIQSEQGYAALEPLVGYRDRLGVPQYNQDRKLYLDRRDLYGLCGRGKQLKFQQDQEEEQCGFIPQPMTEQFCTQTLNPRFSALSLRVSSDGTNANIASLVPGIQKNFSMNTYRELVIEDLTVFHDSYYNATDCSCTNMLLETHYTVYYSDFQNSFNVQSQIANITVDLVYGQYIPPSCSANVQLTKKTSIKFKQSIFSRKNSGGPGYVKGKKLLTGFNATSVQGEYVNMSSQGFALRGADNQGNCYNLKTSLTSGLDVTNYLIETPNEQLYMDDPILSFDDSTIYGCKLQLTRQELQDLCQNKGWQNLMIFQNIQRLKYVGRYGNSNPHYLSDWIEATMDRQKDKSDVTVNWDNNTGTCNVPSSYFLQIFFSKINTRSDPQYQIIKVSHYVDQQNAWVYKKSDPTQKQDFQAILSLQFYEVNQDDNFYAPPTPNPFKALPRNILYPFYVYGGATYDILFSITVALSCISFLVL